MLYLLPADVLLRLGGLRDFCTKDGKKLAQPLRMGRPSWGSDKISICNRLIHRNVDTLAAGEPNVTRAGWIRGHLPALDHVRRGKQLSSMT
jgi:hypothetical protein